MCLFKVSKVVLMYFNITLTCNHSTKIKTVNFFPLKFTKVNQKFRKCHF